MHRFWNKVEKTDNCWVWKAAKRGRSGYGAFKWRGKVVDAHRMSWILTNGKIPKEKLVCHRCDNKLCVNPDHLFLGSYSDNLIDAIKKNKHQEHYKQISRLAQKNKPKWTKINQKIANQIRSEYVETETSYGKLAQKYKLSKSNIRHIVKHHIWKHG